MKCPNCGHELPLGKEKCMYCGAALREMDSASVKETSRTKRAPLSDNAGQDADEAETSPGREQGDEEAKD